MNRRFLTVIAVLAILLQGLSAAWAVMPSVAPLQRQQAAAGEVASATMPCHQHRAAAKPQAVQTQAHAGCCHGSHCQCAQFCSLAAAVALPTHAVSITTPRSAQARARTPLPQISGAHTLLPIRPPINRSI